MNSNKKLLLIVAIMLLILMIATVVNVALNFRDYSYKSTLQKANAAATYVRDGLTAHMVNGIMDKREFFLNNIKNHKDIKDFWIIRSDAVIKQFGPGFKNEGARDEIDKEVLKTGKVKYTVTENTDEAFLRVTIPYKASAYGSPNCLQCHKANEGDVLGAITVEFDITDIRMTGILTIAKIILINIIFLIIALIGVNYFFKPILNLFDKLGKMIQYARMGDYSKRITLDAKGEGKNVVEQINTLFEKLEETFEDLKNSLSTFVANSNIACENPLEESKKIINELSNIYKFKKTIELDDTSEDIYKRLYYIFENKFMLKHYKFYIINNEKNERKLLRKHGEKLACDCSGIDNDANQCRAFRTGSEVISEDFNGVCQHCKTKKNVLYICIPFQVDSEVTFILMTYTDSKDEYMRIHKELKHLENYFDAAKPVLESKLLMQKLKETTLKDGLTGLYNRRFLENFIDQFAKQAERTNTTYAILMIDIDFFKMVNDNYGHDVGDMVIKELAYILKTSIRASDMAIRYGGEEFLVLLHNPEKSKVIMIAQNIVEKFKSIEFQIKSGETFTKTLSIGIAYYPEQANSIWKAIKFADTALYKAKNNGRDQVVEFTPEMNENGEQY